MDFLRDRLLRNAENSARLEDHHISNTQGSPCCNTRCRHSQTFYLERADRLPSSASASSPTPTVFLSELEICSACFDDSRVHSKMLLEDLHAFQDYAFHPMLLPGITFATTLRSNVKRRNQIKDKLTVVEDTVRIVKKKAPFTTDDDFKECNWCLKQPQDVESLFDLLHGCGKDQASCEGGYDV